MQPLGFRSPQASDAARLWYLAPQPPGPDRDSCYAYLLLCTHFQDTGVVAARGDEPAGFALGYRPPLDHRQLFVWVLGVSSEEHDSDLGVRLLEELLARPTCADVEYLCMTVGPRDPTLRGWLERLSRRCDAPVVASPCFSSELFAVPHLPDQLLRLGPLRGPGGVTARRRR